MNANSVLDLNFAEIVQHAAPGADLAEDFRFRAGNEDVACIAAIHHTLCNVNAAACDVAVSVNVRDAVDRAGMYTHSQFYVGMFAQNPG